MQVADRLVSEQRRGGALFPLDQMANKLLIYRARDAIVSIGYAGQAFIGDVPTDEWIAQLISGVEEPRGPDEDGGVSLGRIKNNWDIGRAVRDIRDNLLPSIAKGQTIQVCVAGHQSNRHGLLRPLIYEMELKRDEVISFYQSPRQFASGVGCISSLGVEIGDDERTRILNHLRAKSHQMTGDNVAEFLTSAIRKNSQPGVGKSTSAVILPAMGCEPVRSKFFPTIPHYVLLRHNRQDRKLEAGWSPWIIGPGLIKPPTVEIGISRYSVSGLEIEVEGSAPPMRGVLSAMTSIPRFRLPARFR